MEETIILELLILLTSFQDFTFRVTIDFEFTQFSGLLSKLLGKLLEKLRHFSWKLLSEAQLVLAQKEHSVFKNSQNIVKN